MQEPSLIKAAEHLWSQLAAHEATAAAALTNLAAYLLILEVLRIFPGGVCIR